MPLILSPFRFRDFRLWSGANLISITGTWMQVLAVNWLLFTATGSAAQMGLGVLLHAVPVVLLGPWAGAIADRTRARPLLTATQLVHVALSVGLALAALPGSGDPVPWLYAAMLAGGVVSAVEGPTLGRLGSTVVDRDRLGPALAVGSLTNAAGRIAGLATGGVLIAAVGPVPLFVFNAASFLAVVGVLYLLRPAGEVRAEDAAAPAAAWAGLRYLLRDPTVAITLGLAFLLGSLGRNYQVTMAAMSAGPLQSGADGYGMLSTVFAVGAVVGGLLAARSGRMYGRHLVAVGLVMSVLQGGSALAPGLGTFAAAVLPIAAAAVVVDTVVSTRLQLDQPLALRGRVLAAIGATGAVAGAAGAPVLGWLCDILGPREALGLAGMVTTIGCLAAGLGYGAVHRRRDRDRCGAVPPDSGRLTAMVPAPRTALGDRDGQPAVRAGDGAAVPGLRMVLAPELTAYDLGAKPADPVAARD